MKIQRAINSLIDSASGLLNRRSDLTQDQAYALEELVDMAKSASALFENVDSETGESIIKFLNQITGGKYQYKSQNKRLVDSLLEKYTADEIKAVVLWKHHNWVYTEWEMYLRPSTLFQSTDRKDNFLNYLTEAEQNGFLVRREGHPAVAVDRRPEACRENVFSPVEEPMHPIVEEIIKADARMLLRSMRAYPVSNELWGKLVDVYGMQKVMNALSSVLSTKKIIPYLAQHLSNIIRARSK
ncbi:conserved phage C-terminal domain-containing protein [uncultured Sphaerochaeta sp.]|uniref:conserved phage C-terminal domain-containing protein n=1 Tax=uncultured Sphaerochaeta sp. TaxID=886478 RepID=UPI00262DAEA9|nr:conserved phage C-terminal domain-containing protein [uncultured Sphaerochaeta sp.]